MGNEYNGDLLILRDTSGNQMSLARFFQLALVSDDGKGTQPSGGEYYPSGSVHNGWDMHTNGIDGKVPSRTPVAGTVVSVYNDGGYNGGAGNWVVIKEDTSGSSLGKERYHRFMHHHSTIVSNGDAVQQGDQLGWIGTTGDSSGCHLHYDVCVGGYDSSQKLKDPIQAYDSSTLPSGWNMTDAAKAGNWDYIQLDNGGVDYGPPGGEAAATPFFTDKPCYDISHPQGGKAIQPIINSGAGGVIIGAGRFGGTSGSSGYTEQASWATDIAAAKGKIPIGIYFYSYIRSSEYEQYGFEQGLQTLKDAGIQPKDVDLGIWIDVEDSDVITSDKDRNFALVKKFCKVFEDAGYPLVGLYSSASFLASNYRQSDLSEFPLWAAYISFSFDNASRATLNKYLPEDQYKNIYVFQHNWTSRVDGYANDLDGDKVLMEMPRVGSGGGSGGGSSGGGSYTEVIDVTVDIIPPKRIYFSPVPGLLDSDKPLDGRKETITITTDAESADLYYTTDGSSPYTYYQKEAQTGYAIAEHAVLYKEPVTIHTDTHIRVVAVPAGSTDFEKPIAKGSGTFLFKYKPVIHKWEEDQKSYALKDDNTSFFEENKQAFLLLHATITDEEVHYSEVYKHDNQVEEEEAVDHASQSSGTASDTEEV